MNPDYKKYTLIELYDVQENIDRECYPERYNILLHEIELREKNSESKVESNELTEKDKASISRVLLIISFPYFSWSLIHAYRYESIWYKHDKEYFLSSNPEGFYIIVSIYIALLVASLYAFFIEIPNKLFKRDK